MFFYCYTWHDPKTGIPRYVGKGQGNRVWEHLVDTNHSRTRHMLRKRFKDGFICLPKIIVCETEQEAIDLEISLIKFYGRQDLKTGTLFNLTNGGEGTSGLRHSEQTKLKMSASHSGKSLSEEHKKSLSNVKMGKELSSFHCEKISKGKRGKPWTTARVMAQQKRKNHATNPN